MTSEQVTAQNFKRFFEGIRPYLNGAAHSGFTPVGTVISVMGKTAPLNYLVCDGTVYNIADYSELANYFAGQFEAANFFGGDGVTTFAVPDLRGEFLRGTGTNSHTNQGSGAAVGVHQDATFIPHVGAANDSGVMFNRTSTVDPLNATDVDSGKKTSASGTTSNWKYQNGWADSTSYNMISTRPTNTSILYCIATKNIFMDAGMNFSTEEQVVGTWIDGKKIYQKTVVDTFGNSSSMKTIYTNTSIKEVVKIDGTAYKSDSTWTCPSSFVFGSVVNNSAMHIRTAFDNTNKQLGVATNNADYYGGKVVITIQYTKTTS